MKTMLISGYPAIHKTRFKELGYWHLHGTPSLWQCVDLTGDKPRQVGTQYATEKELLANLEAYATEYGCEGANPKPVRQSRPTDRSYEGQAHYMSKAADSLVTMLCNLDYSKFDTPDAVTLTANFHMVIRLIELMQEKNEKST